MKKIFVYSILCFLSLLFSATQCDDAPVRDKFMFKNASNDTIYIKEIRYIDIGKITAEIISRLRSESAQTLYPNGETANYVFRPDFADGKIDLSVFIVVSKQTIDKYTDEDIANEKLFKLYTLTYDDIRAMDFVVTYTGK